MFEDLLKDAKKNGSLLDFKARLTTLQNRKEDEELKSDDIIAVRICHCLLQHCVHISPTCECVAG